MSKAAELLNGLDAYATYMYTANPVTEEHIVIGEDRIITVPEELKRIAVQFDHNVESVTFDCPRYCDGLDMSEMKIYINYMRPDNARGMFHAYNVRVDDKDSNIMHFDWTITNNVTLVKGKLQFLVCVKKTDEDGYEENHWNSELNDEMYISEGLECEESILENHPDIITDLLTRMEYVETIATPENMQEYVDAYFTSVEGSKELKEYIYEFMRQQEVTSDEFMAGFVADYLDKHPPLFVIGPTKPGIACLWFNTGESDQPTENQVLTMSASGEAGAMYAEVDNSETPLYDFDIV